MPDEEMTDEAFMELIEEEAEFGQRLYTANTLDGGEKLTLMRGFPHGAEEFVMPYGQHRGSTLVSIYEQTTGGMEYLERISKRPGCTTLAGLTVIVACRRFLTSVAIKKVNGV